VLPLAPGATAVDWTKLKLSTTVMSSAPAPHTRDLRIEFVIALMALTPAGSGTRPMRIPFV